MGTHLVLPAGDLSGAFEPSPCLRLGLATSYADGIRALGAFSYTRLDGTIPVHYLVASSGFDLLWRGGVSTAAALSVHYARTRKAQTVPMQLDGGESEFGVETRASWTMRSKDHLGLRLSLQTSMVFTRPHPSFVLWAGTDFTWTTP
ncbi:MAG: hypothetical protein AAB214_20945 [Fibrobacterota bacterium]